MIVYNLTVNVAHHIHEEWIKWVKEENKAHILSLGIFTDYKVFRLINIDETDGPTFAIQMFADNIELVNRYLTDFAPEIRKFSEERWGNNIYYYRTLMESVQ